MNMVIPLAATTTATTMTFTVNTLISGWAQAVSKGGVSERGLRPRAARPKRRKRTTRRNGDANFEARPFLARSRIGRISRFRRGNRRPRHFASRSTPPFVRHVRGSNRSCETTRYLNHRAAAALARGRRGTPKAHLTSMQLQTRLAHRRACSPRGKLLGSSGPITYLNPCPKPKPGHGV